MSDKRIPGSLIWLVLAVALAGWLWRGHVAAELGRQLAAASKPGDIEMLSSQTCGYCDQARAWFSKHGVAFSECIIETDAACEARVASLQAPGTPVIVVRGQTQVGFDPQRIARVLVPSGQGV